MPLFHVEYRRNVTQYTPCPRKK